MSLKDETERFDLPSFKILGASWGIAKALAARANDPEATSDLKKLRTIVQRMRPVTLTCATEGNHGRAVAWMARHLGLDARVYVPTSTRPDAVKAIRKEGATVVTVEGTYDDAVHVCSDNLAETDLLISDTSWPGYEVVPHHIIEGYSTMFAELRHQLCDRGCTVPPLAVIPVGVGALATAAVRYLRHPAEVDSPTIVAVEPTDAACALASAQAGRRRGVPGPYRSIMAGLNCGLPSYVAWPELSVGIKAFAAIDDDLARDGMRRLASLGIPGGPCAGATVGCAQHLLTGPAADDHRRALGITDRTHLLLLVTEGVNDREIVHSENVAPGLASSSQPSASGRLDHRRGRPA